MAAALKKLQLHAQDQAKKIVGRHCHVPLSPVHRWHWSLTSPRKASSAPEKGLVAQRQAKQQA
jgi:hypothetical protein